MDLLTTDQLRTLFERRDRPCVSIFMQTHRAGREIRQDPIRLKNLLRDAETRLLAAELRAAEVKSLLAPAQKLLEGESFWRYQDQGLALFLSRDFFRYYRLPLEFRELVIVADRFHVKPLLRLFDGDGRFFVLALSQNQLRLFQGTRYTISELDLQGVPRSLAEALKYDNPETQLQVHTIATQGAGAVFHGQGVGIDEAKKNLFRYFRKIDIGLKDFLKDHRIPMVLAGVDYLLPIYRDANSYPVLLDAGVTGNPEGLSATELHSAAWRVVEPHFQKARREAEKKYIELCATGRCSKDVKEILPAAFGGRVESAFISVDIQQWGAFDPDEGAVVVHQEAQSGDEDLLNLVAVHTTLNRGSVYVVAPAEMPNGAPVAALFRY
jgi:hypothetical protein